jgi:beta-glucosidase-like glycosyl hydrolase/CubicO group peptidase (beta-lactamase class C family)
MNIFRIISITLLISFFGLNINAQDTIQTIIQEEDSFVTHTEQGLWVNAIMKKMSLDEKIGQLFMIAAYSNKDQKHKDEISYVIKKYKIGGLIFFQGGPIRQAQLTNHYQSITKTPLMIAIDGEWGLGMRLDSTISYPRQMMLGAVQDNSLIYQMGQDIAEQMLRLGIHVNFAPVVDVNNNALNPVINVRSFGEDVENVSNKSIVYMRGMQDKGLIATAKHFPGHGDTDSDSHYTLPTVAHGRARLDSVELYPFQRIFDAGIKGVMVAHLNVPALGTAIDTPTTLTKSVVTDLLQEEMGFDGLIFTDALNMKGATKYYDPGEIESLALQAGNDVLLFPVSVSKAISKIKRNVRKGIVSKEQVNKSCRKVLLAKYEAGLFNDDNTKNQVDIENLNQDLNKLVYNITKLDLIQSSMTVIRNENDLLPIKKLKRKKFASLAFSVDSVTKFQNTLSKYAKIDHFIYNSESVDSLKQILSDYDLVFTSIHNTSYWPSKNYKVSNDHLNFIADLAEKTKVSLSLFANPYSLRKFDRLNQIQSILVGYYDLPETQSAAAQIIFGGLQATGKLPVSINEEYKVGTGIKLKKKLRLQYGSAEQAGIDSEKLYKIDSISQSAMDSMATPGCRVLVARNGIVFYDKSFGYHTYLKQNPVKENDIYDIASITKIASTIPTLMKLYEDSVFSIDSKLSDYLPELDTTNKGDLIIKDILTHQARLNGWIPFYYSTLKTLYADQDLLNNKFTEEFPYKLGNHAFMAKNTVFEEGYYSYYPKDGFNTQIAKDFYTLDSYTDTIYDKIRSSNLLETKAYKYSDLGYYYFYKIIENKTKATFQDYVDSTFYQELGAYRTSFLPLNKFDKSEIVPTENDQVFRKQLLQGYVHDPGAAMLGGVCGHAGLFSTAGDLAKLMQMYLNVGEYGGIRYFDTATVNLFTTSPFLDNNNRRALGFDKPQMDYSKSGPTCQCISGKSFGHSGFTGTLAWADPEEEIVYIFLSNRIHPDQDNSKLIKMNIRTDIQEVVYDAIIK